MTFKIENKKITVKHLFTIIVFLFLFGFAYYLRSFLGVLNSIVSVGFYVIIFYLFHIIFRKIRKAEIEDFLTYFKNFLFKISVFIFVVLLSLSCFAYYFNEINKLTLKQYKLSNGKKEIVFQEMIHIGNSYFYESIIKEIKRYKENNGVYFFEGVKPGKEENNKKFNKIIGIKFDKDFYKNFSNLYGLDFQENYDFLGLVNSKDYNIDISIDEIIDMYGDNHYEENSKNIIDLGANIEKDLSKLNQKEIKILNYFNRSILNFLISNKLAFDILLENTFPDKKILSIILEKRNKNLVQEILKTKYNKIFITYGALHFEGVFNLLKSKDPNWKIIKEKIFYPL